MENTYENIHFIDKYNTCLICNSTSLSSSFAIQINATSFNWSLCDNCGLTFQNPRLAVESILQIYNSSSYWGKDDDLRNAAYSNYEANDQIRIKQSFKRLKKIVNITGLQSGSLLDIGCATGFFGFTAKQYGFTVLGIEPSEVMAEFGIKNYGIDIFKGTLDECPLEHNTFDMVSLWGTDSHFLHPKEGFRKIVDCLHPNGFLVMNYQDFSHWIRKLFPGLKKSWNAIYNFSERSLRYLFNEIGLDIIFHKMEWQCVSSDHLFRLLKLNVPSFLKGFTVNAPAISFKMVIARKIAPLK